MSPIYIGFGTGVICCFAVGLKRKVGYDDALDVVGVHLGAGLVGSLAVGLFADPEFFGGEFLAGTFFGGGFKLLGEQALANAATMAYCFAATTVIMLALKYTIGVRVSEVAEHSGLDLAEHAEIAYAA